MTKPPTMKAYVCRSYGGPDVIQLQDVPKPAPREDEVLVRIQATTVTAGDWRVRSLDLPKGFGPFGRLAIGFTRPRQPILGTELAGVVESVGARVTRYKQGDPVFAFPGGKMASHAQYRTLRESGPLARTPARLSVEEAASLPFGGITALHFLRKANVQRGDKVLVVGASGNVGTALVQLAKHMGAEVTGVTSGPNAALVASLGAQRVIDYTREDAARTGERYDIIMDAVGGVGYARWKDALANGGRYAAIAGGLADILLASRTQKGSGHRVIVGPAAERPEDVQEIAMLADAGALRPVIEHTYEFAQMREAHARVETRRKRGSVVVRVGEA